MRLSSSIIVPIAFGLLFACKGEAAREQALDVMATPGVRSAPVRAASERPMAHRREGQALLDSARTAVIDGHRELAATLFRRAAGFFTIQASAPPSGGTGDLLAVGTSLDSLSRELTRGRAVDTVGLDRISTHANLAEAERHGALAAVAWSVRSRESVGDELTMAADHVERAALDAGFSISPTMKLLLAELRVLVRDLAAKGELDLHELDEPLDSLHVEIHAMHTRLDRDALATSPRP